MKLSNILFRVARAAKTVEVLSTGSPKRILKYAKNRMVSKVVYKVTGRFYK